MFVRRPRRGSYVVGTEPGPDPAIQPAPGFEIGGSVIGCGREAVDEVFHADAPDSARVRGEFDRRGYNGVQECLP